MDERVIECVRQWEILYNYTLNEYKHASKKQEAWEHIAAELNITVDEIITMPVSDPVLSDEDYIIMRAKEAQQGDIYSAKSWMLTAKTLFPSNFKIQFEAYLMEKQSGHVKEAAESFNTLMVSRQNINHLLPEISAITNSLKSNEKNFLSLMFDKFSSKMQMTILRRGIENSDDTVEHCRLLVLLLKKFPQLADDGLVKKLMNANKGFNDNRYARVLVVETLPLPGSLQSPRLLLRLLIKAIDIYNSYVNNDSDNDIIDPWQRLYAVLDLVGRQLGWDPYLINYNNSLNSDLYFQKLLTLRNSEDCRQLLYCGTIFFLRSLNEQKSVKESNILLEAFSDPELPPSKNRKGDVELTGTTANQFQSAANCWELLHSNEIGLREFFKLANKLQVKPEWLRTFTEELALYRGRFDEAVPPPTAVNLSATLVRVSVAYCQNNYPACLDNILLALNQLNVPEGSLEPNLIVGGSHRHLHFLPLTKNAIIHYFCTLLIRVLLNTGGGTDLAFGHMIVLMQLGWPQEETLFLRILDSIRQKGMFHYPLFQLYIIHIDILEEFAFLWNEQASNVALDILPNSQQHLGQRRIGTRGADKGVKEDFKQAMKAQVARSNESLLNLVMQFLTQERALLLPQI